MSGNSESAAAACVHREVENPALSSLAPGWLSTFRKTELRGRLCGTPVPLP